MLGSSVADVHGVHLSSDDQSVRISVLSLKNRVYIQPIKVDGRTFYEG